jgi:hypothetical protein
MLVSIGGAFLELFRSPMAAESLTGLVLIELAEGGPAPRWRGVELL